MIFVNDVYKERSFLINKQLVFKTLKPDCPHITEEIYQTVFKKDTITYSEWPKYDEAKLVLEDIEVVVQVNGKLRDKMTVSKDLSDDKLKEKALSLNNVLNHIVGKEIVRIILIKGRLINIVVK